VLADAPSATFVTSADLVPVLPPDGVPVSFLVDYDGTIAIEDVGDVLIGRHVADQEEVGRIFRAQEEGLLGSRDVTRWDMGVLPGDAELLRREAAQVPQDEGFPAFVQAARAVGALVEVVSDGLGFYVASNLARLDPSLASLPVATNANLVRGPDGVSFPYGHATCLVCGTCKRERVQLHGVGGRVVVFIGDGASDRYAAHHADIVFAKSTLLAWGRATRRSFLPWTEFAEITEWLAGALLDGRLPTSSGDLARWRAANGTPDAGFICGPERWGDGRRVPDPSIHDPIAT
jgi:2-hydroxy-3-keto-5-methylthiopentenyl-1-phosphate phosphatase